MDTDLRYPIGKYEPVLFSVKQKEQWLNDIKFLPQAVENAILNLDEAQIHTPYREGGWTVQQLVHHIADSHINAYCRCKLALTEEHPVIRAYDEKSWALLDDVKHLPVNISITLLYALHTRWHELLKRLPDSDWDLTYVHPEYNKVYTVWYLLGMYAWHGRHHVAHILRLRERNGW
ncbi:MAG TPA: putative metal-dependent hydrolase [Puia sp.]|nr:putative metal-dependent hydrolase [Puia sp.]